MTQNSQIVLLEHSQAKVNLYRRYFSIFLNIIARSHFEKIYLFDFFCGEGVYDDGSKGSPIVALEAIKEHHELNNQTCPDIEVWLNDLGESQIEEGVYKIERVKREAEKILLPPNVKKKFFQEEFETVFQHALIEVNRQKKAISLFFIDPYGYKLVSPNHIKQILSIKNTEVIFFSPASMMHRFAKKSYEDTSFDGGEPLRKLMKELAIEKLPDDLSLPSFIEMLKEKFKQFLPSAWVDTFTLQRNHTNTYCLFFFTQNIKGFEKMLESKWTLDESEGKGFRIGSTLSLFSPLQVESYPTILEAYIREQSASGVCTNQDIYHYGLEKGYLPKHSTKALDALKAQGILEITSLDARPARGYYLDEKEKRVKFTIT